MKLVIDGASVSNLAHGGNSYLYNGLRNNGYVKFAATSSSTQISISANNPGFVYYIVRKATHICLQSVVITMQTSIQLAAILDCDGRLETYH